MHSAAPSAGGLAQAIGTTVERFREVRDRSLELCRPLQPEDCVIQSMPDVSPTRWHLAHTTWFFENFVLAAAEVGHRPFDAAYGLLFNSYYRTVGEPFPRHKRGLLSRPTFDEILGYREHVDRRMVEWLRSLGEGDADLLAVVELGLQHEQQHQELILTDIKHVLSCNPLHPAYEASGPVLPRRSVDLDWVPFAGGVHQIGHDGDGFAFDNEGPRHRVFVEDYELASRPVSNGEFMEFIADGGYRRTELWLDDGWRTVRDQDWQQPLYWQRTDGTWHEFTLAGLCPLDERDPVCHVSYYEADAFARWAGARLPTEQEWEVASADEPVEGNLSPRTGLHPAPASIAATEDRAGRPLQMFGDVWEWTASAYAPYPGYAPLEGSLGEYNGKFMCSQMVLRGGSVATPRGHVRRTYRNFLYPHARWQFSGLRLARSSG